MRRLLQALVMMCAASAAAAYGAGTAATQPATRPGVAATGTIRGTVAIEGGALSGKPSITRTVMYLGSSPALDAEPLPERPAQVEQINKSFQPDFLVIRRGMVVEFPNWDHVSHNVFSRSAAAPAFDLDRYPYGQSKSRKFEKLGVVQLFCNIHPQMRAVVFVTPNRCWTRPDAGGQFTLTNVPPGKYELVAWNDRCGDWHQSIEVGSGAAPPITVTLHASAQRALVNHGPERPEPYGVARGLPVKREVLNLPVAQDAHPAPGPAPAPGSAPAPGPGSAAPSATGGNPPAAPAADQDDP